MLSKYKLRQQVVALITAAAVFLCMMPLSDIPAQAEDSLETVTPTETHPEGITIDLFDYWLNGEDERDDLNANEYSEEIHGGTYDVLGINNNHTLKFGLNIPNGNYNQINQWTHSAMPRTGIVQNRLDDNGYPTLAVTDNDNGESLAYLFNEEAVAGKSSYMNVGGLLQQNEAGYYYYNSKQNFAAFDEDTNSFILYDKPGVKKDTNSSPGQFFPFNTANQVFINDEDTIDSQDQVLNHYFGVHMKTRFQQPKNGVSPADGATPVTFSFSGDDDVWIFIDGVLVADLGGIHDALSVEINFESGAITIYKDSDNDNQYDEGEDVYNSSTIKQEMNKAGINVGFKDGTNTFADETYHTLDFFYLERGNVDSNMNMQFNLTIPPESTLTKVDQDGKAIENATFELYEANGNYEKTSKTPIATGTTDNEGTFTFTDEDGMKIFLGDLTGDYYILEETSVPSGYRSYDQIWLRKVKLKENKYVLLSSNQWDSGAYAMPTVRTIATTTIKDDGRYVEGSSNEEYKIIDKTGSTETQVGLVFAVAMTKDGNAIYGDPIKGWTISEEQGVASVREAIGKKGVYVFGFDSANRYAVDIENIPGDIQSYQWVNNNNYEYTIGYYYAEVGSIKEIVDTTEIKKIESNEFTRDFAVKLYAANIQNRLIVQKIDKDNDKKALAGATYSLYDKTQVTDKNNDGKLTDDELSNIDSVKECTTEASFEISKGHSIDGAAAMTGIPEGAYYLVETDAPEGYDLDATAIEVIVDNQGVHVNAGAEDDAVSVQLGVGKLVKSMAQFAVDDGIDASLHDITATLQTTDNYTFTNGGEWTDTKPEQTMELSYSAKDTILEYGPAETGGKVSLSYDSGWGRLNIQQDAFEESLPNGSPKTEITQSLNNLYSTTTIVKVKNKSSTPTEPTSSVTLSGEDHLSIEKVVEGDAWPDNAEFSFTIEADGGLAPMPSPTTITIGKPATGNTATAHFGNIIYTQAGTYKYIIKEVPGNIKGMTYDTKKVSLTVTVTKNGDGSLTAAAAFDKDATFTNTYDEPETDEPDSPGTTPSIPDGDDTPDLNTVDHYSYIVGYPEDYRTGEPTDDEERWPVKPQGNITRAEVATIFYRLLTDEARSENWTQDNTFTDVDKDDWFNTPVSTLSAMGIIGGYDDSSFQPNAPITRAEFAAIAVRFFEEKSVDYDMGSFIDIDGDEWYADAIQAAKEYGIIGGYPDGSFQPEDIITRAEACSIVNRTLKRIPHKEHLLPDSLMRVWPDNADVDAWYYEDMQEATSSHEYEWIGHEGEKVEHWTDDREEIDWDEVERELEAAHGLS